MSAFINVGTANVYREADYRSEVITQGVLAERVAILDKKGDFSRIRLPDGYEGWLSNYQLAEKEYPSGDRVRVTCRLAMLHSEPVDTSPVVRDAVIGCRLEKLSEKNDWYELLLPDGLPVFGRTGDFGTFPALNRESVVKLARLFLGIPYYWGGRSPKGFDCSGLTQTVFGLLDVHLPRDAWMQHRDSKKVAEKVEQAAAGDLLFFAENGDRITHVGIALGNGQLLHARGFVRINSLIPGSAGFDNNLKETFVSVHTVF